MHQLVQVCVLPVSCAYDCIMEAHSVIYFVCARDLYYATACSQGRQAGPTLGQITSSRTPSRRKPVPTPPRITGSGTSRMFKVISDFYMYG
jgi:hypothetical protein